MKNNKHPLGKKRLQSELLEDERKKQIRADSKLDVVNIINKTNAQQIRILLSTSVDVEVSFLSISIKQARMVYDDERVVKFFEFRMWVTASQENDLTEMEEPQILLRSVLEGKRFLLVMDDVWNNHEEERDMFLKFVSTNGKPGSKILLTTPVIELSDLPDAVLLNIFSRLPIRTVFSCKCVCKEWHSLISDPTFPKLHFSHARVYPILRTYEPIFWPTELHLIEAVSTEDLVYPLKLHSKLSPPQLPATQASSGSELDNIPKFGIVDSCNGLLCVCTTPFNNPICICNPITGEYIMLPRPVKNPNTGDYIMDKEEDGELLMTDFVVSGFGFCPKTNQYKVMRVLNLETEDERYMVVQALTLGSSSWRTLGLLESWKDIGLKLTRKQHMIPSEAPYRPSYTVYLNGAIHWLCNRRSSPMFIDSFNFASENVQAIPPPIGFGAQLKQAIGNMRLGVLHDCLYVTDISSYTHFDLWVLKDYNDSLSWTKEMVIDTFSLNIWPRGLYRPIKYLDNGDLLMFHPSNALVCYNPEEKSIRYFKIHGIDSDFEMVPHTPSLISFKDAINVDDPQVEILNTRNDEKQPTDWEEYGDFTLAEEDEEDITAAYSKIVEENSSFKDAFTTRHWE